MYTVPVVISEAVKEVSVDSHYTATTRSVQQQNVFRLSYQDQAYANRVTLTPNVQRLTYDRWKGFELPTTVPSHTEKVYKPGTDLYGDYTVSYQGVLNGGISYTIDLGPFSDWLGVQTAVLYGVYTADATESPSRLGDWSLVLDLSKVMQWSTILFLKRFGGTGGVPLTWFFKYIGLLLPNPGKIEVGLKVWGQTTAQHQYFTVNGDINLNLTSLAAKGILAGEPNLHNATRRSD